MEAIQEGKILGTNEIFGSVHKLVGETAKEVAEREFELLEFNLFLSSAGKKHLDKASKSVQRIRELERQGKINLEEYEELTNNF